VQLVKTESVTSIQYDQAAAWIARLSSDCHTENDLQDFSLWLAKEEAHKRAYDETLNTWQTLEAVKHLPFEFPQPHQAIKETPNTRNTINWLIPTALAASLLVVTLLVSTLSFNTPTTSFFSTAIGQQKTITLDDGSTIVINTNTHLEVSLSKHLRNIHLYSGEAYFVVAKDPSRPFIVKTCFSAVRALGTAFNIRCDRKKGMVTVTEGSVQVVDTNAAHDGAASKRVEKGQSINIDETLGLSDPVIANNQRVNGWRKGEFIFENTPLTEVINEANRYSTSKILLGSPQLAQLPVTGRLELTDTLALVSALKVSLSLESITLQDNTIILNPPTP